MDNNIIFKNRTYTINSATGQVSLVTADGNTVPVSLAHPALAGLKQAIEDSAVAAR